MALISLTANSGFKNMSVSPSPGRYPCYESCVNLSTDEKWSLIVLQLFNYSSVKHFMGVSDHCYQASGKLPLLCQTSNAPQKLNFKAISES